MSQAVIELIWVLCDYFRGLGSREMNKSQSGLLQHIIHHLTYLITLDQSSGSQPSWYYNPLIQFLMLWWSPTIKLFSLLLHNCNISTVRNHNVNIRYIDSFIQPLWKGHSTPKGITPHRLRAIGLELSNLQKQSRMMITRGMRESC